MSYILTTEQKEDGQLLLEIIARLQAYDQKDRARIIGAICAFFGLMEKQR